MSDREQRELDESCMDDALLVGRIKNIVMGETHFNSEGETIEEQSKLILKTIARQLRSSEPSRAALGYLAHCLERSLDGRVESLDEAFYTKHKRTAGGQPVASEVDAATVRAYIAVIKRATWTFDPLDGEYTYSVPSKEVLKEADHAALAAYRKATGKDHQEENEPEKKISQTIKPILKRMRVLR